MIRAKSLHKTYQGVTPVKVLNGLNLEVKTGETVAIMGKSGTGKSTLLHILGTLEKFCSGELEICDQKLTVNELRNKKIGFVFQAYNLLDDHTALENVLMPALIKREKGQEKRALELLELVGLKERAHFLTKLLSGGEKQRVAIARALMNDPDLILADEPSGNLDRATSKLICDLLISVVKKFNKTLIVVTHDVELASACDRILILKDGQLCTS